jgi:hypothetical protein
LYSAIAGDRLIVRLTALDHMLNGLQQKIVVGVAFRHNVRAEAGQAVRASNRADQRENAIKERRFVCGAVVSYVVGAISKPCVEKASDARVARPRRYALCKSAWT